MRNSSAVSKWAMVLVMSVVVAVAMGCSTTQKTPGGGLTSVVAQNVVRIACVSALRSADLTSLSGKSVELKLTGFSDEKNKGILELLFRSKMEESGARIVAADAAEIQAEVATMSAGNDQGRSSFPLLSHSERTEGSVDVLLTLRNPKTGEVISSQPLTGAAKYQQTTFIGLQGGGIYYVKTAKGKFEKVPDPTTYK